MALCLRYEVVFYPLIGCCGTLAATPFAARSLQIFTIRCCRTEIKQCYQLSRYVMSLYSEVTSVLKRAALFDCHCSCYAGRHVIYKHTRIYACHGTHELPGYDMLRHTTQHMLSRLDIRSAEPSRHIPPLSTAVDRTCRSRAGIKSTLR